MRVAICEDFLEDSKKLKEMIITYFTSINVDVDVDCFSSCDAFVKKYKKDFYQILFLGNR